MGELTTLYDSKTKKNSETEKNLIIIFLDIDGVLNTYSKQGAYYHHSLEIASKRLKKPIVTITPSSEDMYQAMVELFDADALKNLDELISAIEKNGYFVGIVISSGWRESGDVDYLQKLFSQHGFSKYIIDKTMVDTLRRRHLEIEHWLRSTTLLPRVKNYVILDDSYYDDLNNIFESSFIHCPNMFTAVQLNLALKELEIKTVTSNLNNNSNQNNTYNLRSKNK